MASRTAATMLGETVSRPPGPCSVSSSQRSSPLPAADPTFVDPNSLSPVKETCLFIAPPSQSSHSAVFFRCPCHSYSCHHTLHRAVPSHVALAENGIRPSRLSYRFSHSWPIHRQATKSSSVRRSRRRQTDTEHEKNTARLWPRPFPLLFRLLVFLQVPQLLHQRACPGLSPLAVEVVRVAFRVGSCVVAAKDALDATSAEPWSTIVTNISEQFPGVALAEFHQTTGIPLSNQAYVSTKPSGTPRLHQGDLPIEIACPNRLTTTTAVASGFISKGKGVLALDWAVMLNGVKYPDPENYHPERCLVWECLDGTSSSSRMSPSQITSSLSAQRSTQTDPPCHLSLTRRAAMGCCYTCHSWVGNKLGFASASGTTRSWRNLLRSNTRASWRLKSSACSSCVRMAEELPMKSQSSQSSYQYRFPLPRREFVVVKARSKLCIGGFLTSSRLCHSVLLRYASPDEGEPTTFEHLNTKSQSPTKSRNSVEMNTQTRPFRFRLANRTATRHQPPRPRNGPLPIPPTFPFMQAPFDIRLIIASFAVTFPHRLPVLDAWHGRFLIPDLRRTDPDSSGFTEAQPGTVDDLPIVIALRSAPQMRTAEGQLELQTVRGRFYMRNEFEFDAWGLYMARITQLQGFAFQHLRVVVLTEWTDMSPNCTLSLEEIAQGTGGRVRVVVELRE
ncbi:uncharacterized protein BDZ99DRAFT_470883 [Mytilinidion resinicola]|uniref:Starter acyltransferase (SAT) domain-containing protein n=1 Tax=Mytilinidion resinicola TaxID=574789 RepID=A0A6A6ZA91_9PEZI|nr:uncharacterized protein BDZ99DRAFT_470883 [Mytilinidion resinicola]KAF2817950.1 hypothetical protein BDZ99DRAFT_470883 [Mytilinidion resinicola]